MALIGRISRPELWALRDVTLVTLGKLGKL
jgi:hypothetical protein